MLPLSRHTHVAALGSYRLGTEGVLLVMDAENAPPQSTDTSLPGKKYKMQPDWGQSGDIVLGESRDKLMNTQNFKKT